MMLEPQSRFIGESIFDRIIEKARTSNWSVLPIGELMGRIAKELEGTPYVAYTLEADEPREYCTINLEGLDCVTFFESTLNLARIIKQGKTNRKMMVAAVRFTRYRRGVQRGYESRLHYTTDWIFDNVKKGVVEDLSPKLPGAQPFTQKVGYMSAHPESYKQLVIQPNLVDIIRNQEEAINKRQSWFVPMDKVADVERLLQTGDIVGICTTQEGIDIAHTGLCIRDSQGVLRFMDASSASSRMQVTLEGRLSEAIRWSRRNTGIVIARPLEP